MSIWDRLFGRRPATGQSPREPVQSSYRTGLRTSRPIPADYHSWTMPRGLETEGVSMAEFVQATPNDQLRSTARQLPIEHLLFDDIEDALKKNGWALEVVMAFSDQLATYKWRLKNQPSAGRRGDLPADELKDIVVSRLIRALEKHTEAGHDVTPSVDRLIREQLARNLLAGGYPEDARRLYKICSRQSYQPPAQREAMNFWMYFCLYRIAFISKNRDDAKAALGASKTFTRPAIDDAAFQGTIEWLERNS